jgi:glutamate synthase domain-containing protein 1/glutamate synthase domain-containing protein 3
VSSTRDGPDRAAAFRRARAHLRPPPDRQGQRSDEAEGGCGVTGFVCTVPVSGKHIYEPSIQMRNRGNGKGGGIAACGLVAEDLGVSQSVLDEDYILQIALLDPSARGEIEKAFVAPHFDVDQGGLLPTVADYRDVPLLEVEPPSVARYFVRVKPRVLERFATERGLSDLCPRDVEDEFVVQNSVRLNDAFYASLGDKRAFVLSHARNLIIVKIVGYAEAAVQYYCMPELRAHAWIAHQRYPTKGRVWHPAGAHPFIGLNEALVHNGDFANYHAVGEYLRQRNVYQQFLTDTEVSVQLFDLLSRVYRYPIEYVIEALAPTTELDFDRLPAERRLTYRQIQALHLHASPDGPWFFIIARSLPDTHEFQLLGITDTAMLRPQVFALQEGEESIGLICSEKQAIDATLASLSREDARFNPIADQYWNARGGSHSDGGAFLLTVSPNGSNGGPASSGATGCSLRVTNKFGEPVRTRPGQVTCDLSLPVVIPERTDAERALLERALGAGSGQALFEGLCTALPTMSFDRLRWFVDQIVSATARSVPQLGIEALTLALDRRYPTGNKKRSSVLTVLRTGLGRIFAEQPLMSEGGRAGHVRVDRSSRQSLRAPAEGDKTLLIDAAGFPPEGPDCDARLAVAAYELGWRHLVHYNCRGTRFHACGFGPATAGLHIECYDNPGDYLGSGMDGLEVVVHGNAQDQLLQIAKGGRLVVHGDVGQTFMYGAKGGVAYIRGNAAGRPMINAVGRPRVVINGTALDYLAESFMAGDPLDGGGFAVVNGLRQDVDGTVVPLELPFSGSNLLSLASGGAIYVRDPHRTLVEQQLNGGAYRRVSGADWTLILPYLQENERQFGVRVQEDLLTVDGVLRPPREVYRKVVPAFVEELDLELEMMGA